MTDVRFPILNAMRDTAPAWTRGAFDAVLDASATLSMKAGAYDESKHPRRPKGAKGGGQFAPKGGEKIDFNAAYSLNDLNVGNLKRSRTLRQMARDAGVTMDELLDARVYFARPGETDEYEIASYFPSRDFLRLDLRKMRRRTPISNMGTLVHELSHRADRLAKRKEDAKRTTYHKQSGEERAYKNQIRYLREMGLNLMQVWQELNLGQTHLSDDREFHEAIGKWIDEVYDPSLAVKSFDESKHPRKPRGTEGGGQFAPKFPAMQAHIDGDVDAGEFRVRFTDGKKEIGYVAVRAYSVLDANFLVAENSWTISGVLVSPAYRRQGRATEMYHRIYELARQHGKRLYMGRTRTEQGRSLAASLIARGLMTKLNEITFGKDAPAQKSFDASKHPRKPRGTEGGGQFAPKGGGAGVVVAAPLPIVSKFPPPTVSELEGGTLLRVHQFVSETSEQNARELFVLIPEYMRRGLKTLTLRPDSPAMKAGLQTFVTAGDYDPAHQALRLFGTAKPMPKSEIAFALNHEAGHHLYHRFGELTLAERNLAKTTTTAVGGGAFMTDEDLLYGAPKANAPAEYYAAVQTARAKYPMLAARRDFMRAHDATGGVTNYSESYTKVGKGIAADETFAELTRFYMDDVHHGKPPLYRFYEPTHPQYPKRVIADAYLKILKMMQEYDAATATKAFASVPADEDSLLMFFDADGNECAPEDAVMAELRTSDGGSVIYFVDDSDSGEA